MSGTIDFCGEELNLAADVGIMPMMRLSRAQQRVASKPKPSDADVTDLMATMLDVIEQCLADEEWNRFEHLATVNRIGTRDLEAFLDRVMRAVAARPTGRSIESSIGPQTIEPSSTDDSSSPVIARLNGQGRPDLALLVRKRQESLSA